MFTIFRKFFRKFFRKKRRREIIVKDKVFVSRRIKKAKKAYQSRVFISGSLSKEIKKSLKEEGCRIVEYKYATIVYTAISW